MEKTLEAALVQYNVYSASTMQRDKLLRFADYAVRWLWIRSSDAERTALLAGVMSQIKMARKLFRFGRTLEFVQQFVRAYRREEGVEQWLAMGKAVGFGGWLFYDSWAYLCALKVVRGTPSDIAKKGAWLWSIGILCGLATDVRQLLNHWDEGERRSASFKQDGSSTTSSLASYNATQQKLLLKILCSLLDLSIPTGLILEIAPRTLVPSKERVFLYAMVSSLIYIYMGWPTSNRIIA